MGQLYYWVIGLASLPKSVLFNWVKACALAVAYTSSLVSWLVLEASWNSSKKDLGMN